MHRPLAFSISPPGRILKIAPSVNERSFTAAEPQPGARVLLREYARHRLIGTPLDGVALAARRAITKWRNRATPVIRDAVFEDDFLKRIVRERVTDGTNCVDIGAHLGAMTSLFLKCSPSGKHACVEPTPYKAAWLRKRYPQVDVIEAALAETPGEASFFHQANNSGYSGLSKHEAGVNDVSNTTVMTVQCDTVDRVIPADRHIGFVKIDVEGAELRVFRGAERVLTRDRPTIIFEATESGLKSSGIAPTALFEHLSTRRYEIRTPRGYLEHAAPLDEAGFLRAMTYPFAAFSFVASPLA